jgi:hypothetical protein
MAREHKMALRKSSWHATFTAIPFLFKFILSDQRLHIEHNICARARARVYIFTFHTEHNICVCVCIYTYVYTHISDAVHTVYELPLPPNETAVKHFYTNQELCEVLTGYLSLCRRPD